MDAVGGEVGDWGEEAPFLEEGADCGEGEGWVEEDVGGGEDGGVWSWGQAGADQEVGGAEEEDEGEADYARGPGEGEDGEEPLEHEGEDDAADTAAAHG